VDHDSTHGEEDTIPCPGAWRAAKPRVSREAEPVLRE
jgi:hypothetical protein